MNNFNNIELLNTEINMKHINLSALSAQGIQLVPESMAISNVTLRLFPHITPHNGA